MQLQDLPNLEMIQRLKCRLNFNWCNRKLLFLFSHEKKTCVMTKTPEEIPSILNEYIMCIKNAYKLIISIHESENNHWSNKKKRVNSNKTVILVVFLSITWKTHQSVESFYILSFWHCFFQFNFSILKKQKKFTLSNTQTVWGKPLKFGAQFDLQ